MKHIKRINEFRTIGFRYSEPTMGFKIKFDYEGDLSSNIMKSVLDNVDVKFENIEITNNKLEIDIFIYNERELESIVESIIRKLNSFFEIRVSNIDVREHKENL